MTLRDLPLLQRKLSPLAFITARIALILAIICLGAGCAYLSQLGRSPAAAPSETATPTPTPSPSPTETPEAEVTPAEGDIAAQAANEAEQKARQAARKAAEAAAMAAEASSAAHDAAKAAAKAVAASKSHPGATHHHGSGSTASSRSSASPGATPTAGAAAQNTTQPSPEPGAASSTRAEEAAKAIDKVSEQLKQTDRAKLAAADAQRYDIATGLLNGARKAMSKDDYMAATSLAGKAKVLLNGMGH